MDTGMVYLVMGSGAPHEEFRDQYARARDDTVVCLADYRRARGSTFVRSPQTPATDEELAEKLGVSPAPSTSGRYNILNFVRL